MSTKKRAPLQSPPHSMLNRDDALSLSSLEESINLSLGLSLVSSHSSTLSMDSDNSEHSLLTAGGLRRPPRGRGHPLYGPGGLHYSAPGHGCSFSNSPLGDAAAAAATGRRCMDTHHQAVGRMAEEKAGHSVVFPPTTRKGSSNSLGCEERDLLDSIWPENGNTRLHTILRT